jgi:nitroreductase
LNARTQQFSTLRGLLDDRWTCRQYLPDPVTKETIERLLGLAQRTPSWCNTQPWHVEVTIGEGTKAFREELAAHVENQPEEEPDFEFPAAYHGVYRERRRECGYQLYNSLGIAKGDRAGSHRQQLRNLDFFDAPHVAIVTTEDDLGVYGAIDCGLYIATFLLGAQSLGLAATPQAALAAHSPLVRQHFGLPAHRRVVAGISFGYADLEHPVNKFRTSRAAMDTVVTWHGG